MFYSPYQIWVSLIVGTISAYLAWKRGKNPLLWFGLGALLGIFGLLFLIYSKPAKKQQPPKQKKDPNTIDITPQFTPEHKNKLWYYLGPGNQQEGPMSFDALSRAWRDGKINPKTYLWNEALDNWKPLSDFLKTPS